MPYGDIAGWRTYALARGNSAPTAADDTDANAALQRATDYIRMRYVLRYGLSEDADNVIEATYIAATQELSSPGFWSAIFTPSQAKVLTNVKGIQWTPVDQSGYQGSDAMQPVSPLIEGLLAPGEGQMNAGLFVL